MPLLCNTNTVEVIKQNLVESSWPSSNTDAFNNLDDILSHLESKYRDDLISLIRRYPELLKNTPGRTDILEHDVDVQGASPIKQSPYRLNPEKGSIVRNEIKYMLDNDLIVPSKSPWSSL